MRKLCNLTAILFAMMFCVFLALTAFADSTPLLKMSGVSVKVPDVTGKSGIRFKITVDKTALTDVEIVEEGAILIALEALEDKPFTLDTMGVQKIGAGNEYYSETESCYEYIALMNHVPVYKFKTPICARGYIRYSTNRGEIKTVYSNTVTETIYSIAGKVLLSGEEKEETKMAVKTFITDAYDSYMTREENNPEKLLTITSPKAGETVYPYIYHAKKYLEHLEEGKDKGVLYYLQMAGYPKHYYEGIEVKWENGYENTVSYTVTYATKPDFSDALSVNTADTSVSLYNLYKATDYYVKVTANLSDGTSFTALSSFKTTELGPRTIRLDGAYNVRDIGGYMTPNGRTMQGLIYRGGQLNGTYNNGTVYNIELTESGKYVAEKLLKIKTDMDHRSKSENSVGGITESPIPGAELKFIPTGAYNISGNPENYRKVFSALADINNYPIYFHCQGGADRTGTVAYLLNALLGVGETDLRRDYEFTSFSLYGWRAIDSQSYIAKEDYHFFDTLNSQKGDTLAEKTENWLLSIGVTEEEIKNIKSIMLTGKEAE
ncbi:MAG: tyrosine-protein phosphatase [Clostridia bacterium]|nr:tyrosine-protein phosphatase [Clostridia bacterium]